MSDEVYWLPNWKGTRLHAVVGPEPQKVVLSACGIRAYPMNARDRKRIAKGIVIPRCKHCETFFPEKEKTAGVFLDAWSVEALAFEITRKLFTDVGGKTAKRLVLEIGGWPVGDGLSEADVRYSIEKVIASFRVRIGGSK